MTMPQIQLLSTNGSGCILWVHGLEQRIQTERTSYSLLQRVIELVGEHAWRPAREDEEDGALCQA